jgi:hypothetical protein
VFLQNSAASSRKKPDHILGSATAGTTKKELVTGETTKSMESTVVNSLTKSLTENREFAMLVNIPNIYDS